MKKITSTTVFLLLLLFFMIFGFDENLINVATSYNNICVGYININITFTLFIISFIIFGYQILKYRELSLNKVVLLLLIRIPLYFVPLFYIDGIYKIGDAYAIIQCFISFIIGQKFSVDNFKYVLTIFFISSILISCQVLYTMLHYDLNFFSIDLKWYMVIPLGRYNYIACMLLPLYYFVDTYIYKHKKILSFIYSIIILLTILGTGSRWGLVLFVLYNTFKMISFFNCMNFKKTINSLILLIVILLFVVIFYNDISKILQEIILKFTSKNIFSNRLNVYFDGLNLFSEHFLLGRSAYNYFIFDASKAHNFVLESLIQTGLIGTTLYLLAIIYVYLSIFRIKDSTIKKCIFVFITGYLIQGLVEPNLFSTFADGFFWLISGITYSFSKSNI